MNGISSNLQEEIKKTLDSKNKEKFKFIAAILLTNIMVAIVCLPSGETKQTLKNEVTKILHKDYQVIILPLVALVDEESKKAPETLVSLINKDKKIITEKAYLHEEVSKVDGIPQFKIEIPNGDLAKVGDLLQEGVVAVPYVEVKKMVTLKKRGSKYEVNL